MKTRITDKFLWDLYNFLERTVDSIPEFYPYPTIKTVLLGPKDSISYKYLKQIGREKFYKLIIYLKRKNYIKAKNLEGKRGIIITKKGIDKALKSSFRVETKKKRKDSKWIMLIFDMPAKYRKSRDLLRSILKNLGYKMFQQSVWITPYDVSENTEQLLQLHSLDQYVKIFLIEEI